MLHQCPSRSPTGRGHVRLVELADQRRDHMRRFEIIVVIRAVKISRIALMSRIRADVEGPA